jgi:hypothetical protein
VLGGGDETNNQTLAIQQPTGADEFIVVGFAIRLGINIPFGSPVSSHRNILAPFPIRSPPCLLPVLLPRHRVWHQPVVLWAFNVTATCILFLAPCLLHLDCSSCSPGRIEMRSLHSRKAKYAAHVLVPRNLRSRS